MALTLGGRVMVHAVYRPRQRDVMLIDADGDVFVIPHDEALPLADALRAAFAVPAVAGSMAGSPRAAVD